MTAAAAQAGTTAEEFVPDQNALIDYLLNHLRLKNDSALANVLGLAASAVSKIRNGYNDVSAGTLIRMHEVSGIAIKELRAAMGDRRKYFRSPQGRPRGEDA